MARPCKIPEDPNILNELLENIALGVKMSLIADAIEVPEKTIYGWLRRKDFKKLLACKKLETLREPLKAWAERDPKGFIQSHKDTRDDFAPPAQTVNQSIDLTSTKKAAELTDDELASMVDKGKADKSRQEVSHEPVMPIQGQSGVEEEGEKVVH